MAALARLCSAAHVRIRMRQVQHLSCLVAGVRACAICPGYVDTDFTAWTQDTIPPTTMLSPQDVTETVAYLLRLSENAIVHEIVLQRAGR